MNKNVAKPDPKLTGRWLKNQRKVPPTTLPPSQDRKVYAYERYSTARQHVESFHRQTSSIGRYASGRWVISQWFRDPETSGTLIERDGLNQLLEACEKNPGAIVICEDVTRMTRSYDASAEIFVRLRRYRAELHSAMGGPMNDLLIAIGSAVAAEEHKMIVHWLRSGRLQSLNADHHSGTPPYGFKKGIGNQAIPDDVSAAVVKEIFNLYAGGLSAADIAVHLTDRGVKTPGNKEVWTSGGVLRIIDHPMYGGFTVYNFDESFRRVSS